MDFSRTILTTTHKAMGVEVPESEMSTLLRFWEQGDYVVRAQTYVYRGEQFLRLTMDYMTWMKWFYEPGYAWIKAKPVDKRQDMWYITVAVQTQLDL